MGLPLAVNLVQKMVDMLVVKMVELKADLKAV
jgi:hypothetical protein